MKNYKPVRVPAYTRHKPTGQGRVRINGRDYYLGPYNSAESLRRYDELIGQHLRDRSVEGHVMTVDELCLKFIKWTEGRYRKHGRPTEGHRQFQHVLKGFCKRYGRSLAVEFRPRNLKEYRTELKERGLCRSTVNTYIRCIVRAFAWAVSEEFVPETVHRALATVDALRLGEARDNPKVRAVPLADVEATERFMNLSVRGLVRFQLYTGARPGEARIVRPCDIDKSGPVWKYVPQRHKTEHHGADRVIYIGPRCQELLTAFEPAEPTSYYFVPVNWNHRSGEHYSSPAYIQAIWRACKEADVPRWYPHRLRHTAATFIRAEFDLETARIVLGHTSVKITEIYAERDERLAVQAIEKFG